MNRIFFFLLLMYHNISCHTTTSIWYKVWNKWLGCAALRHCNKQASTPKSKLSLSVEQVKWHRVLSIMVSCKYNFGLYLKITAFKNVQVIYLMRCKVILKLGYFDALSEPSYNHFSGSGSCNVICLRIIGLQKGLTCGPNL